MSSIQQADTNQLTFDVYSKSAEALKEANKLVSIDKIDETMADIQEALNTNTEIEEALKSPVGFRHADFDESELNLELNELLAEEKDRNKIPKKLDYEDTSFNMDNILETLNSIKVPNVTPKNVSNSISIDRLSSTNI